MTKSRFVLLGVLALALCVIVGMSAGVAGAKKKKKKAGAKSVTVSKTAATTLPPSTAAQPPGCDPLGVVPPACTTPGATSLTRVPLNVAKVAKGQVVSTDSLSITYSLTGSARVGGATPAPASASLVNLAITAPNGRTVGLANPGLGDANATNIGPVTVTSNSPFTSCLFFDDSGTTTVCTANTDPDQAVNPPSWTGTLGNSALQDLAGSPASGDWTVRVRNLSTTAAATLSNVSLTIGLTPGTSKAKKKKTKK